MPKTLKRHPRHARDAAGKPAAAETELVSTTSSGILRAFEALAKSEQTVEDLQTWLSYLYAMRHNVLSPLLWSKFEKFMESRQLEMWDVSYDDLPQS